MWYSIRSKWLRSKSPRLNSTVVILTWIHIVHTYIPALLKYNTENIAKKIAKRTNCHFLMHSKHEKKTCICYFYMYNERLVFVSFADHPQEIRSQVHLRIKAFTIRSSFDNRPNRSMTE